MHRSNDRLEQDLEICAKYKTPLIITSLGARVDLNQTVHAWGGHVLHDVIDDRFGRKAIEKGADGLIAVAAGAGGHAGRLSPFALVQELRAWFDGPIALSGSIANGSAILAAQAMGADFAYIGSLFIATREANAVDGYKQMIVDSTASDIVYSNLFTGVHGNYLRPSILAAGLDPDALPQGDVSQMSFGSGGASKAKAWRDIWGCGQGIGTVGTVAPAGDVVWRLGREYAQAKAVLDGVAISQPADASPEILAGARRRSHADIRARATRAGAGFRSLGLGEGDVVAMCLRNDFALFEASLGAGMAGADTTSINWHATADEAGYILRDCSAKALVVHADLFAGIAAGVPQDLPVLVVETPAEIRSAYRLAPTWSLPAGAWRWEGWLARHEPMAEPDGAWRAAVIYTSGTTGRPKGVRRASGATAAAREVAAVGYGLAGGGLRTVLMNGPMYHSAPNSYGMIAFYNGARIVLQPRFDAEEMLALIERHCVTHMHIVPTMFVRLLRLPAEVRARYDVSSLRHVVHGAAPCPPEIKRAMIAWWGPVIHEYYGSSETGLITEHGSEEALSRPGTVGRTLPGVEVRVLGEDGAVLPMGEAGEIYVRSAAAEGFSYIGPDAQRAEVSRGPYVTIGDVGYVDADGYLYLCDRKRDMIISGGVNVYPAEVEAALLGVAGVRDCAVFGIPDPEFGEAVCAHVQVDAGGPDVPALRSALGATLSRFKIPREIVTADDLPREDSGKIFKRKLRAPYWADAGRSI